ncbi:hypothetical protein NKR23_g5133 [Pleurostoma richardsiae]|uniref:Uncharacterized protein n=1 Tax=Pleurostoma richardsiae TaxID=41990 RepID=A0AA38RHJ0_9PEZI|nr:hypothetical protein NKR23_g5133 [Pleurostoma richardsiae]
MVETLNVENFLHAGHWTIAGARSPRRSFNEDNFVLRRRRFPPNPTVEDEAASVAQEHDGSVTSWPDEETKFPGDLNQDPILLPVPDDNPERRFILITPPETTDDEVALEGSGHIPEPPPAKSGYEANTCRKYVLLDHEKPDEKHPPPFQRRRSRVDLPRIETDVLPKVGSSKMERAKSATYIDQEPRDYFDHQKETVRQAAGEAFLSPIITQSTKGRERAYWDFNVGLNGAPEDAEALRVRRRGSERDSPAVSKVQQLVSRRDRRSSDAKKGSFTSTYKPQTTIATSAIY